MVFRVRYSSQAEADLDGILEWLISHQAGVAGLRWFDGLENAIGSLVSMPWRCPLAPENATLPFEVRHLLYGRRPHVYRILFRVIDDAVYILHIWHGSRRQITRP
jgi:plasmid stabilization system protein ParE